jgi:hypothetical protein
MNSGYAPPPTAASPTPMNALAAFALPPPAVDIAAKAARMDH